MRSARSAAVITWVYAAGFGIPAVPVSVYLRETGVSRCSGSCLRCTAARGRRDSLSTDTLTILLISFLLVTVAAAWAAWLLWRGSMLGALTSLIVLPVEAVFWLGFALPFPFLAGLARAALIAAAWRSPHWPVSARSRP